MATRETISSMLPVAPGEILVADDDEAIRKDVIQYMSSLGLPVAQAETTVRVLEVASEKAATLDCILLDISMPDSWDLLEKLRSEADTSAIPVLLLNESAPSEANVMKMLKYGVIEHITKPLSGPLLCANVAVLCERSRANRELKSRLRFALEHASHDALTGLFNRRYFERRLKEECAHAKRHRRPFAIVILDLDQFTRTATACSAMSPRWRWRSSARTISRAVMAAKNSSSCCAARRAWRRAS